MKNQSIKKVILAALLGAFSCVQAGSWGDLAKNAAWSATSGTASFVGNLGLASACSVPAMELGMPIFKATQNRQYLKAITKYAKPFVAGAAILTLANYIEPKNAGIVMSTCKHALETLGTTILTLPAAIVSQELIQRPLFEPYDKQSTLELLGKYLASLGVGFTSLQLSKMLSTDHIIRYFKLLMSSTARGAITYPTIFLTKKTFAIDEAINKIEDPNDRRAALTTFHLFANIFLSSLIG